MNRYFYTTVVTTAPEFETIAQHKWLGGVTINEVTPEVATIVKLNGITVYPEDQIRNSLSGPDIKRILDNTI